MPLIGRPKVAKTLPKGLGAETIAELLRVIDEDCGSGRRSDWAERDRAIVLTAVLAGLRADKLVRADVGHIRLTDEGGVIHVHGKGNKDRRIPLERALIHELEAYLDSRQSRFPGSTKWRPTNAGLAAWPATAPLFVGSAGQRITGGTLQYRVLCLQEGRDEQPSAQGVLVHGFRHTCDRARQRERQRLRAHEAPRTRVDGDLAALRRWRRDTEPRCGCPEPALPPDRTVVPTAVLARPGRSDGAQLRSGCSALLPVRRRENLEKHVVHIGERLDVDLAAESG